MRQIISSTALCSTVTLYSATAAVAQDQSGEEDNLFALEEIVVTAQFRQQNLQDTPLSITAVTGDMLEMRNQTNISDVGAQAPNVTLREAPATYGPAISAYIRGVGQRDTSFALEPGVGIYIDDVYHSTLHGSLLELIDLDRVEILRGPQGTLAGQNSIGGAIKLYSKKPRGEGEGYLQATYGSYNRMELRGGGDFTVVPGKLFARVSGTAVEKDGYVTRYDYACTHPGTSVPSSTANKDCVLGTDGGKSYVAGRLATSWTPTERLSVDLIADVTRDSSETSPSTLLYVGNSTNNGRSSTPGYTNCGTSACQLGDVFFGTSEGSAFIAYSPYGDFALDTFSDSPYISYENYMDTAPRNGSGAWAAPLKSALDTWGISANIDYEISDTLSLKLISAYREYSGVYTSADGSPVVPTLIANEISHNQFSQEIRLSGQIGTNINFTLGGYYFDKESENITRVTLTRLEFMEDNVVPAETIAAFANVDIALTEKLSIGLGGRYTDQEKTFVYGRDGIEGDVNGGNPPFQVAGLDGLESTFKGDRFDYRGVVQYSWTDDIMTYAQISTGFKGGGVNARPFFVTQAQPHGPETLTAYEVGLKGDFWDRKARINVSAFLNKYDDILMTVAYCPLPGPFPPAPCFLPINAGKADVKGIEFEASLRPTDGLMIDASLAYLDFDYTSISADASSSGITLDDDGPYIQKWQWSLGAQYMFDLGDNGSITPRVDISYEDDFNRNPVNSVYGLVEGRTLVNARITYRTADEDWQISLEGKNLTDKLYYTDVFDNRGSTTSIQGRPGEPRTLAVTIKRNF